MQTFNWFEFMYDNFVLIFYLALGCILFVIIFTGWIIKHSIGTKVMVVRKTTAEIISAKENIGKGTVKVRGKLYKKVGEPVFMSKLLKPYRMYIHQDGSDKVISLATFVTGEIDKDANIISNAAFQDLLESEVIQQSVRGLVGTMIEKLVFFAAGGGVFILVWEILRGIFT